MTRRLTDLEGRLAAALKRGDKPRRKRRAGTYDMDRGLGLAPRECVENTPCRVCGDDSKPLHYNRMCPACYASRPAVEESDALTDEDMGQ